MELTVSNVNQAVAEGFNWLRLAGVEEPSRNGPVIVAPEPVLTTYLRPTERVLFSPVRDANPFFHLMEALWMLAGRQDIAWPAYFNKNFRQYSDDGVTQWGAYGARWRNWFGYDQLKFIAAELRRNPASRRCVLTMWDATSLGNKSDLDQGAAGGVDVPCNTQAYVDLRNGALNLTVLCRSNDMLFGGYGANAVHMSVLQEYLAAAIGAPVGLYRQFSSNYHVYPAVVGKDVPPYQQLQRLAVDAAAHDYYLQGRVAPFPLVSTNVETWDRDLEKFFTDPLQSVANYEEVFFAHVAAPVYRAWYERKECGLDGLASAEKIAAPDWNRACTEWITRHAARKATPQC